jgi:thiosulfate dehydrogenase (quinone) large subunit
MRVDGQRRRFCQAAGLVLAGAALPACGTSAPACVEPTSCGASSVSIGVTGADIALGTAFSYQAPQAHVFVCRDAAGVYAVDAGCTHLGCDVNFVDQASGFLCPCHGATYDFNGEHPTAPAPSPLAHYAVCAEPSGTLVVDTNQIVDACVRLVV